MPHVSDTCLSRMLLLAQVVTGIHFCNRGDNPYLFIVDVSEQTEKSLTLGFVFDTTTCVMAL